LHLFYAEARRVLKPDGVFAASAYNWLKSEPAIDEVVNRSYYHVVGPFWPLERALIEKFEELHLPFPEVKTPSFEMIAQWNVEQMVGPCGRGQRRNDSLRRPARRNCG
jgi:hypothetical protein